MAKEESVMRHQFNQAQLVRFINIVTKLSGQVIDKDGYSYKPDRLLDVLEDLDKGKFNGLHITEIYAPELIPQGWKVISDVEFVDNISMAVILNAVRPHCLFHNNSDSHAALKLDYPHHQYSLAHAKDLVNGTSEVYNFVDSTDVFAVFSGTWLVDLDGQSRIGVGCWDSKVEKWCLKFGQPKEEGDDADRWGATRYIQLPA